MNVINSQQPESKYVTQKSTTHPPRLSPKEELMQRSIAVIAICAAASQVEAQPIHPRFVSSQVSADSIQFNIEFEEPLAEALDALGPGVGIFEMYVDTVQDFTD